MENDLNDAFEKFTSHFKKILITAQELAISLRNKNVEPLHLLYAITVEQGSIGADILAKNKFSGEEAKDILTILNNKGELDEGIVPTLTNNTQKIIENAATTAYRFNHRYIGTEHLLYSLIDSQDGNLLKFLGSKNVQPSQLRTHLEAVLKSTSKFPDLSGNKTNSEEEYDDNDFAANELEKIMAGNNNNQESALNTYAIDLTDEKIQDEIDPVIGRDREIERLIQILSRRTKNNPILLGDPGVGKTAIIEGLAKRISEGKVPDVLVNKRILSLDLGSAIAGTIYRGEFENRIKKIIKEVKKDKNIILFIDEIHNLMGAGSAGGTLDAANLLKPELARGHLRCVGATTPEEYKKYIASDAAFERRFQPIMVIESTRDETIEILRGLRKNYEKYHHVKIDDAALTAAVDMSMRYLQDKYLPDKAIDLIDEAASKLKVEATKDGRAKTIRNYEQKLNKIIKEKEQAIMQEEFSHALALKEKESEYLKKLEQLKNQSELINKKSLGTITKHDIADVISRMTRIPVKDLALSEKERLLHLEDELRKDIIGQDPALKAIAQSIRRSRTGLSNPHRPIGSFIFLGPSGVGKTETAKVLARQFFGREDALIRVDMSEFSERFNISKLIGAPAGYVGYKEQGTLTDSVKHQPYSVVLFDEIEKAHPDVYNLLLPVLEDGQLTDATGKTINFKNTIIIMTSNIGLEEFNKQAALGFSSDDDQQQKQATAWRELSRRIEHSLHDQFRPEFLNRIDDVIIFQPLDKVALQKIAKLQVEELLARLHAQNLKAQVTKNTFEFIVRKGFSPDQGARGIRRAIQEYVEAPLADKLLSEEMTAAKLLKIGVQKNKISIT
ncbi:MAG: ATP-dependent Clp protease ATP-binding subunit [Candidatus Komeilibacteria bacterium]